MGDKYSSYTAKVGPGGHNEKCAYGEAHTYLLLIVLLRSEGLGGFVQMRKLA